jgi:cytochrome P450
MARKTLRCSVCGRKFSMAAHLARHMNAGHGRKKTARRAKTRRRVGRPPVAGSAPRALRELRAYFQKLTAHRDALNEQIKAVERALNAVG